ncbi:MAG: glycosyltransferase family 39 protein [Nanoarchaeota archaeon]|nr:glycosyltransferase family 39 protein [Nanoarchaeota archaeon]
MIIEILITILVFFIALISGNKIFRLFKLQVSFNEELIYSLALGFAFLSYLILFFGLLGLIYKSVFIIIFFTLFIISIPELKNLKRKFKLDINFSYLCIPIIIFLLLILIGSLSPPTGWDTQKYHLSAQEAYVNQNKISYVPILHSDLPSLANMFILLGVLLKNDILAKLIFYSVFLVLVFSVYIFTKKHFSEKIASLATIIFLTFPMIIYYAGTVHTDMFLSLFTFLSIITFFYWAHPETLKQDNKYLILSAIFAGLAFSTKITAILTLLAFAIIFLIHLIFKPNKIKTIKFTLIFFLIVALIVSPWFIKSYIFTGNPIYPIAYNIFGGPQNLTYATEFTNTQLATGGYGTNLLTYILSPWHINSNGYRFLSSFSLIPLLLAFLPLLFFIRNKNSIIKFLLIFSFIYFTIWFFLHPFLMKLIPIIAPLSIILAYTIISVFERKTISKFFTIFIIFTILFSFLMAGLIYKPQIKVALGLQSKQNYLSNNVDVYNTFNYANNNLNPNSKILLIGEERNYYLDIPFQDGDPTRQGLIDYRSTDQLNLKIFINKEQITHLIVNKNFFSNISDDKIGLYGYTEYSYDLITTYIEENTKEVYESNNIFLYELN